MTTWHIDNDPLEPGEGEDLLDLAELAASQEPVKPRFLYTIYFHNEAMGLSTKADGYDFLNGAYDFYVIRGHYKHVFRHVPPYNVLWMDVEDNV